MKKISKSIGAEITKGEKRDYFEMHRNTPVQKRKRSSLKELWKEVKEARTEKLRKAS